MKDKNPLYTTVLGFIVFLVIFISIEASGHLILNKKISVVPGWTNDEFFTRMQEVDTRHAVIFIGDSRIGWGIAESVITKNLRVHPEFKDSTAYNLGLPATGVEEILHFLQENLPEQKEGDTSPIIIINYGPAFFYHFEGSIGEYNPPEKLQDYWEHQLLNFLKPYLIIMNWKAHNILKEVILQNIATETPDKKAFWESRKVFNEGFVNATLKYSDGTSPDLTNHQLDYYSKIIKKIMLAEDTAYEKKKEFLKIINRLKEKGWSIIMIRLPIGYEMYEIEDKLPKELKPEGLLYGTGIPFIDYNKDPGTSNMDTIDQSHITPESAFKIAPILASDISKLKSGKAESVLYRINKSE